MPLTIHIVEPTLENEAGHCHSFVSSLLQASAGSSLRFTLWAGRGAGKVFNGGSPVEVNPFFFRRARRVQSFFLYRRLLRSEGRIFISTASRTDLLLLHFAASGSVPPKKVYLYFHWINKSRRKTKDLKMISAKSPDLVILGPTASVVEAFRECGFRNTHVAPYPITPIAASSGQDRTFRRLLFAGAARKDKGFYHVARFVEQLSARGMEIPVCIQASPDHYNKSEPDIGRAISRLQDSSGHWFTIHGAALAKGDYLDLFVGAIVLQLYDQKDFADRISGITLDALSMGAPVIALTGTWPARIVERFGAGETVAGTDYDSLFSAVRRVMDNYLSYHGRAVVAGAALQEEHSAASLLRLIAG